MVSVTEWNPIWKPVNPISRALPAIRRICYVGSPRAISATSEIPVNVRARRSWDPDAESVREGEGETRRPRDADMTGALHYSKREMGSVTGARQRPASWTILDETLNHVARRAASKRASEHGGAERRVARDIKRDRWGAAANGCRTGKRNSSFVSRANPIL